MHKTRFGSGFGQVEVGFHCTSGGGELGTELK